MGAGAVKRRAKALGLKQRTIAALLGMTEQTVSRLIKQPRPPLASCSWSPPGGC
ncbi:MAG TPA: helix-turn-helix transcriptional regulator [Stellaceae bacterium]|nr:helix-turn-helix transcriptional regulator [Stellaceae bacterium]